MGVVVKIWLTLSVLFPIVSVIAITEMLSFLAFSVGMAIDLIWSM